MRQVLRASYFKYYNVLGIYVCFKLNTNQALSSKHFRIVKETGRER